MDRLTAMQVFVAATTGSFSAAAAKLDMSRATVTCYVGGLEQWLGARLLQRTTRSVTLIDAGEHCLRRSQQMLSLMEDVGDETPPWPFASAPSQTPRSSAGCWHPAHPC